MLHPRNIAHKTRSKLHELIASCVAPPPATTISAFSGKERILSRETAAGSGKWANIGYQIAMQDAVGPGKTVVLMTATQVGKTEILKCVLVHSMLCESGGTTFMLPSESLALDYAKAHIEPLVRDTPKLRVLIGGSKKDGNSQLFRRWPGGYLRLVGSNSADKLSSFPSPRLIVDELDRCSRVARNSAGVLEGSPLTLFFERNKNWPHRFSLLTSTPTLEDTSAIYEWWKKSDQRIALIPCPHCDHKIFFDFFGVFNRPEWGEFVWEGKGTQDTQKPKTIAYRCGACKNDFTEKHIDRWTIEPEWYPLNPGSDISGFHLNAFYSPWVRWSDLLKKVIAAGQNPARRMTVLNTTGGWPFSFEAVKTPEWQVLANRTHQYKRYEIPNQVSILLAACDVQLDRLEISLYGVYKQQFYLITHEAFHGNPSNIDDEVWSELDEFLGKLWPKQNGVPMAIHRCAIDSHYLTNTVAQFARKRKRIVPVTGVDNNWTADIMPPKSLDIKRNGKYLKTGKKRWPLGVSVLKMDFYGRLKLEEQTASEYVHFPSGMSDEYYKQLTGEVCKIEEDSKGRAKTVWEKSYDAVEALDCAVYTLALSKICGMHLWSDTKWDQIKNVTP